MSPLRGNLHCHSRFSDGADSLEDMVLAAIDKGLTTLGFSEHAWNSYDVDCRIDRQEFPRYLQEIERLRQKYHSQITLYAGLEVDALEPNSKQGLDYTIGSLHYLRDAAGAYHCIDHLPAMLETARDRVAGGDMQRLVEEYYAVFLDFLAAYRPSIVGHIDLITKLNGDGVYFDETSAWYRALLARVAERLGALAIPVEVNTGGILRGYRREPYPSRAFLHLLHKQEVPVLLASDAHSADALDFWFTEAEALLCEVGYRTVKQLHDGHWVDVVL